MEQGLLSALEEIYQGVFTVKVKTVNGFLTINLIETPDTVRKDKEEVLAKIQEMAPKENCPPIKVYARNNGLQILWFDKLKNDAPSTPPDVADTTIGNDSTTVLQQIPKKEDIFFVIKGDQRTGPFVRIQLESMWNIGQITADCVVECESSQEKCSILEFIKNKKTSGTSAKKLTLLVEKLAQLPWIQRLIHLHWLTKLGFVVGMTGLLAIISLISIFRETPEEVVMRWARGVENANEHACSAGGVWIEESKLDPAYLKVVSVKEKPFFTTEAIDRLVELRNAFFLQTQTNVENFTSIKYYQVKVEYSEPKNSFTRTFSVIRSADFKKISQNFLVPFASRIRELNRTDAYFLNTSVILLKRRLGLTTLEEASLEYHFTKTLLAKIPRYVNPSLMSDLALLFRKTRLRRYFGEFMIYAKIRDFGYSVPENSTFCLIIE